MTHRKSPRSVHRSIKTRIAAAAALGAFGLEGLEKRRMLSVGSVPLLPALHTASVAAVVAKPQFRLGGGPYAIRPNAAVTVSGLAPATVRHAYGVDQVTFGSVTGDGTGQTIAIVDAYNAATISQDLHTFDLQFGIADPPTFTRLGQTGTTTLPGNDSQGGWAVETSLDVEWAHAIAPKANLLLVMANSANYDDLMAAVDTARRAAGVSEVSMSWGGSEFSGVSAYDSHFLTPAGHPGVTFIASSGDNGIYDSSSSTVATLYPASSPNVLAIGGTSLFTDAGGNWSSESGWSGSGGGISQVYSQPIYQRGIVTQSATARTVPDVAADADPNTGVAVVDTYDYPSAPWFAVGGTSAAAPMWAGILAVVNQGRALAGKPSLDGLSQTLPKLYQLPASDFHDITTGDNGDPAGPGYDLVTGRGSPIVNLIARDMITNPIPTPVIGALTVTPGSISTGGTPITLTAIGVQESGGTISGVKFYRESNGSAGWQIGSDVYIGAGAALNGNWSVSNVSTTGFVPGTYTYYAVATDTATVSSGPSAAVLTVVFPPPANDAFANAAVLSGTTASGAVNTTYATRESGEPDHAGNSGGHSVWWTWKAATNGKVTIDTHGSDFDTVLAVYTGASVGNLAAVASNDDDPIAGGPTSALTFNAVAGTTYRIAVDGLSGAAGNAVVNLAVIIPPVNDSFANAVTLSAAGMSATWSGSSNFATKEAGEPNHANNAGGASVWLKWTAPVSGIVNLNTLGSNFDTLLAVYTGTSVSKLTAIASNDDDPIVGGPTSAVKFDAVAGTTYRIAVDGFAGVSGHINLGLTIALRPANDSFSSPATLSGNTTTWKGSNLNASSETGEPAHAGLTGGASVWFTWTAPTTRTVKINTHGSNFDTVLAVYTGTVISKLTSIASNDDDPVAGDGTSTLTFSAVAGRTYRIAVDGYYGVTGNIVLNIA